ncbi:hypothetical protein JDW15_09570 [Aerococcaceae bacterium zg-ZJ1578]|uniref:hypothetical protein n=1 Tax=Aerococcaceae bacterium zg-252 TaxID=2796928 RepID=UPI001A1FF155|nr:hypothetical protein [Aerococcaceae bacterium zg-1578]
MKIIAAIFTSTSFILMAIAALLGFRFRDIIVYWQYTPHDAYFPSVEGLTHDAMPLVPLEVIVPLIRISIILSIIFIYHAFKEHKAKTKIENEQLTQN